MQSRQTLRSLSHLLLNPSLGLQHKALRNVGCDLPVPALPPRCPQRQRPQRAAPAPSHPRVQLQALLRRGDGRQHRLPVHAGLDVGGRAILVRQHRLRLRDLQSSRARRAGSEQRAGGRVGGRRAEGREAGGHRPDAAQCSSPFQCSDCPAAAAGKAPTRSAGIRSRQRAAAAGGTCDFGGMMRLIMEVPLPRALSSALINCTSSERGGAERRSGRQERGCGRRRGAARRRGCPSAPWPFVLTRLTFQISIC